MLDQGQAAAATIELQKVLAVESGNKAALMLLRSLREEPFVSHGRDSFAYVVAAGDTLSLLALRFLNDRDQFWSLARYNGIKVPRQLRVGQTIRVPGKARPTRALASVAGPAMATGPQTPGPAVVVFASEAEAEVDALRADRERKESVERATRQARASTARRDKCAALLSWGKVLRLEPFNREAVQQREALLALKPRALGGDC